MEPLRSRVHAGLAARGPGRALLVGGGNRAETFDYESEGRIPVGLDDAWIFENGEWRQIASCAERHLSPRLVPAAEDVLILDQYNEQWSRREGVNKRQKELHAEVLEIGTTQSRPLAGISFPSLKGQQVVVSRGCVCVIGGWHDDGAAPAASTLGIRWISIATSPRP